MVKLSAWHWMDQGAGKRRGILEQKRNSSRLASRLRPGIVTLKAELSGAGAVLTNRDLGRERPSGNAEADLFLQRGREWMHKWTDYIVIGNGAGLAACFSAAKDHIVGPQLLGLCAFVFGFGVIMAALVPLARSRVAAGMRKSVLLEYEADDLTAIAQAEARVTAWSCANVVLSLASAGLFALGVLFAAWLLYAGCPACARAGEFGRFSFAGGRADNDSASLRIGLRLNGPHGIPPAEISGLELRFVPHVCPTGHNAESARI
jgi:hypothetical protein